jgi:glycosyltransferase involved in cell wall biosynthesis
MFVARSVSQAKCSVFINNVNQRIFYRRKPVRRVGAPVILFPGGLQWHQGLDIAIRAMVKVVAAIPSAQLHLYGQGNMKDELVALTRELRLTETVRFFEPVPVEQIAEVMSNADLGVVPKRADSFGNEAYSTKIMEFMSLGVPVVVSSTKIDRFYFNDSIVRFFESGNSDALAGVLLDMLQHDQSRQHMIDCGLEYAAQNSWQVRKNDYLELVDSLIEHRPVRPAGTAPSAASPDLGLNGAVSNLEAAASAGSLVVK